MWPHNIFPSKIYATCSLLITTEYVKQSKLLIAEHMTAFSCWLVIRSSLVKSSWYLKSCGVFCLWFFCLFSFYFFNTCLFLFGVVFFFLEGFFGGRVGFLGFFVELVFRWIFKYPFVLGWDVLLCSDSFMLPSKGLALIQEGTFYCSEVLGCWFNVKRRGRLCQRFCEALEWNWLKSWLYSEKDGKWPVSLLQDEQPPSGMEFLVSLLRNLK